MDSPRASAPHAPARRSVGRVLVGLALLLDAGVASAEPPKTTTAEAAKQAMALNDEAWALYEQGRYRAAIDKLEAAERLDPTSKDLVYNLALIHEKRAALAEAAGYYRRYLEMESDPKSKARVQAILKRLEGAQREIGERAPAPASPAPAHEAPVAGVGSSTSPPASRPVRPWVIGTGAFAGAAALLGTVLGLSALARNPGSGARTGDGVGVKDLADDARTAHSHAIAADVAFVVAAIAAGTATVLYFATPVQPSSRAVTSLRVSLAPFGLGVTF